MRAEEGVLIWAAVKPIVKIALMCGVGAILGRTGILQRPGLKVIGNLIIKIFLPCLIISKLGSRLSIPNLLVWWPSSANVGITLVVGGLIGWLNNYILRVPKSFRNHVITACAIGNTGNLPLVFVPEVISGAGDVLGKGTEDLAMAYVVLGVWIGMVTLFSWAYRMLELPKPTIDTNLTPNPTPAPTPAYQQIELTNIESNSGSLDDQKIEKETSVDEEASNLQFDDSLKPVETEEMSLLPTISNTTNVCLRKFSLHSMFLCVGNFIQKEVWPNLTPPVNAILFSFLLGVFPALQGALFDEEAVLSVVGSTLRSFGEAAIPCLMILLGGTFAIQDKNAKVPWRIIVGMCVTRLIVIPIVGTIFLYIVFTYKWIYLPDRVLPFVMLSQWIVPSSINLNSIATVHQNQYVELSVVLFWQYLCAIFTMPVFAYLFLNIVQKID